MKKIDYKYPIGTTVGFIDFNENKVRWGKIYRAIIYDDRVLYDIEVTTGCKNTTYSNIKEAHVHDTPKDCYEYLKNNIEKLFILK